MASLTFEQVLTFAETLSAEDQKILADLLNKRRTEAWREETGLCAKEAVVAYRAGKLKPYSGNTVITRLRANLKKSTE